MDLAKYAALFAAESRDLLAACTALLLQWERAPAAPPVDDLFRALHSLKGMAATMGHDEVAQEAHALETALAAVRAGEREADAALLDQLLHGVGRLGTAVATVTGGTAGATEQAAAAVPVRVARRRLDRLGRLAAELDIAVARLQARAGHDPELEAAVDGVRRTTRAMAAEIGAARLVPLRELFGRLPMAVREAARSVGRDVELVTEGEAVEADRAVLEALAEPLVHLVRNAIGHGIEPAEVRRAAGKAATGRLRVAASRDRGALVLEVEDDGAGIDRTAIAARARAAGLPEADRCDDDDGLLAVLARPGFSTATTTTTVAGRGVGLDAVRDSVRTLRGRLSVRTTLGAGTTWTVRVPLASFAVRALLAEVGGVRIAVPFTAVREAARAVPDGEAAVVRGRRLRRLPLHALIGQAAAPARAVEPALVVQAAGGETALVVDALLGQQEILVERFAVPRGLPAWVDGATVLADGGTALVLAPAALT